jgi:hypothetical protein
MVPTPGAYGLILRKTDRTKAFYQRNLAHALDWMRRFHDPAATVAQVEAQLLQDEHLFACSVAQSRPDLEYVVRTIEDDGAVRGRDFVATMSGKGVIDPLPGWLRMELSPTGNPPELEAKMTPEVRAMWEANRRPEYHYLAR